MKLEINHLRNAESVHINEIDETDGDTLGITAMSLKEWEDKRRNIIEIYQTSRVDELIDIITAYAIVAEQS